MLTCLEGGIQIKALIQNKKMFITVIICILLSIHSVTSSVIKRYQSYYIIGMSAGYVTLFCFVIAYVLNADGKYRNAVVCVFLSLLISLLITGVYHFMENDAMFGVSINSIGYLIYVVLSQLFYVMKLVVPPGLMLFFLLSDHIDSKEWKLLAWMPLVLSILLPILLPVLISGLFRLIDIIWNYEIKDIHMQISIANIGLAICMDIPYGLVYLFGFFDLKQTLHKTETTYYPYMNQ